MCEFEFRILKVTLLFEKLAKCTDPVDKTTSGKKDDLSALFCLSCLAINFARLDMPVILVQFFCYFRLYFFKVCPSNSLSEFRLSRIA